MIKSPVMTGIDLSHWNVVKDWSKVSKSVDFVMLKIGGEEGKAGAFRPDPKFLEYYYKARDFGLHVGGYFFAGNKVEIIKEGTENTKNMCYKIHRYLVDNDVLFDMPVALDFEKQNANLDFYNTMYVQDWCSAMESLNYYVTIYASDVSGFAECLIITDLIAYDKWVARYKSTGPEYVYKYGMWQYSSKGHVEGVEGYVDMNYAYINYPDIISKKGLNR